MTATIRPVRGAGFPEMLAILQDQQARKIDLVLSASKLRFTEGQLEIAGLEHIVEDDGVTDPNGLYRPTQVFDDSLAERLDIHPSYLRRLREGKVNAKGKRTSEPRLDLYDANANGLLQGRKAKIKAGAIQVQGNWIPEDAVLREATPADPRSFLVRLFRGDQDATGIARVLLSNRFARMDNLDGLMAMLQGIQEAGIDPGTLKISGTLSETRMYVDVQAPEIIALAPKLLDGYRSPFDRPDVKRAGTQQVSFEERLEMGRKIREQGRLDNLHKFFEPGTEPIVFAGFRLTNSEVGNGRWQLVPVLTIAQCSNGLTIGREAFARTHVGSTLEDGHMEWSADTQGKELALVTAQTRDLVVKALSQEFVDEQIAQLEDGADKPVVKEQVAEVLGKGSTFTKEQQAGILEHFLMGGQATAAGVLNAVTSYSQTLEDPDTAYELDAKALGTFEMAASLR